MSIRTFFSTSHDDGYHSDGGDAVAQRRGVTKRKSLSGHSGESSSIVKKSRHRTPDEFANRVKESVGRVILAGD